MKNRRIYAVLAISFFQCFATLSGQNIFQPIKSPTEPISQESQENFRGKFCLYGGIATPVGSFGEDGHDDWQAASGPTIGMQYSSGRNIGFLIDASFARSSAKFVGYEAPYGVSPNSFIWNFYHLLGGLMFTTSLSKDVSLMAAPLFGIDICSNPYVRYSFVRPVIEPLYSARTYFDVEIESDTRIAYEGGVMAQLSIGCVTTGFRYLTSISASRYNMKVSIYSIDGRFSYTDMRSQCISLIQLYAGISF